MNPVKCILEILLQRCEPRPMKMDVFWVAVITKAVSKHSDYPDNGSRNNHQNISAQSNTEKATITIRTTARS